MQLESFLEDGFLQSVAPFPPTELDAKIRLANEGDADTAFILGIMFEYGKNVYRDMRQAKQWYEKAAEKNHSAAQVSLGRLYKRGGQGLKRDVKMALSYFHKSAKQNNPYAWYELGTMYEDGIGLFQSDSKALIAYKAAAKGGVMQAYLKLAEFYRNGRGTKKDIKTAISYYKKLATEHNSIEVKRRIAVLLGGIYADIARSLQDDKERFKWLMLAADFGHIPSQVAVADSYREGRGTWQDYQKAISWYRKLAAQNNRYAMENLGYIYYNGLGVPQNYREAYDWYLKAAELGSAEAAWNLGSMYFNGHGVAKDENEADKWFKRSQSLGR